MIFYWKAGEYQTVRFVVYGTLCVPLELNEEEKNVENDGTVKQLTSNEQKSIHTNTMGFSSSLHQTHHTIPYNTISWMKYFSSFTLLSLHYSFLLFFFNRFFCCSFNVWMIESKFNGWFESPFRLFSAAFSHHTVCQINVSKRTELKLKHRTTLGISYTIFNTIILRSATVYRDASDSRVNLSSETNQNI